MNYIGLINNFWLLSEVHDFRPIDIALYFYLLKIANGLSWKPSLRRNNREIMAKLGISYNTLKDARNRLKQAGLIDFTTYNGKSVVSYKINDTFSKFDEVSDEVSDEVTDEVSDEVTDEVNKTKTKNNIIKEKDKRKRKIAKSEILLPLEVDEGRTHRANVQPPTLDEVISLCASKGMGEEEAKRFYYYYDAQGWVTTGGQKIRRLDSMVNRWLTNGGKNHDREFGTNRSKREARNREVIEEIMGRYEGT